MQILFINLERVPPESRFRTSSGETFELVDFPSNADGRFIAGEHGGTKPVTLHIVKPLLNRFDDTLVLLVECLILPGAHSIIDRHILLPKVSRRAVKIVTAGLGFGRDDVRA